MAGRILGMPAAQGYRRSDRLSSSAHVVRNVQGVVNARAMLVGDEIRGGGLGEAVPVWPHADIDLSLRADAAPPVPLTAAN
jgi:hypothetical protein